MSEVGYKGFPEKLVSRLESLRQRAESGAVNNADSAMAIKYASLLFDHYAGWARNYWIGRVVRRLPDIQYANGTPRERALPEERPWDDPDLMNVGADYTFEDTATNQRLVRDLASDLVEVLGPGLSASLRDAFDDLIFGQQNPLVTPAKVRLKGSAKKLWKLRFEAVLFTEYLRGKGMNKQEALFDVANAYGLNEDSRRDGTEVVAKWYVRIGDHYEAHMITDSKEYAYHSGQYLVHYRSKPELDYFDQYDLDRIEKRFEDIALSKAGQAYKQMTTKTE